MFSLRILWRNRLFIAGVDAEICWSDNVVKDRLQTADSRADRADLPLSYNHHWAIAKPEMQYLAVKKVVATQERLPCIDR